MFALVLGFIYANAGEWFLHKHVLHGLGKRRTSFWSFHFHEHHQACRRHEMVDGDYARSPLGLHAQGKEVAALLGLCLLHGPILLVAPGFTVAVWASAAWYYRVHRKAHEDPTWARTHLRWHYDHHMGPNQDANWCVTWPWTDWFMGTRRPYAGTDRESADRARRARKAARRTAS